MMEKKSFLGTGWSFPPTFNKESRSVLMTTDAEDINRSLQILFSTALGERLMQPKYGANLERFLFEPISETLKTHMKDLINDAILYHEARIKLLDLQLVAYDTEGRIDITLEYMIKGTNSRYNYVYPFYLEEGTNISQ
jgi:phage baseplate assembly protein W